MPSVVMNLKKRDFDFWRLIDGDIFYYIKMWPTELRRRFFRKPNTDQDTMVLFLFFLGKRDSYALVH